MEKKNNLAIAIENWSRTHLYFKVVHLSTKASACISASLSKASIYSSAGTRLRYQFNTGQTLFL